MLPQVSQAPIDWSSRRGLELSNLRTTSWSLSFFQCGMQIRYVWCQLLSICTMCRNWERCFYCWSEEGLWAIGIRKCYMTETSEVITSRSLSGFRLKAMALRNGTVLLFVRLSPAMHWPDSTIVLMAVSSRSAAVPQCPRCFLPMKNYTTC